MCRTCKAENPKWSKGVRVPVKDLPLFFASQPSWNFEQKIYGHNVVVSLPLLSIVNLGFSTVDILVTTSDS